MSEFQDEYSAWLQGELHELKGSLLNDTIVALGPDEPVSVAESLSVKEAVGRMMAQHCAAVLVVDARGTLAGIFTERDVLCRVVAEGRDPERTPVGQVMTRDPEALSPGDRVAFALNRMSVAGYRTVPLVDAEARPVGVVTVGHIIKWVTDLFPEAVLNLRPGDAIKRPTQVDAG